MPKPCNPKNDKKNVVNNVPIKYVTTILMDESDIQDTICDVIYNVWSKTFNDKRIVNTDLISLAELSVSLWHAEFLFGIDEAVSRNIAEHGNERHVSVDIIGKATKNTMNKLLELNSSIDICSVSGKKTSKKIVDTVSRFKIDKSSAQLNEGTRFLLDEGVLTDTKYGKDYIIIRGAIFLLESNDYLVRMYKKETDRFMEEEFPLKIINTLKAITLPPLTLLISENKSIYIVTEQTKNGTWVKQLDSNTDRDIFIENYDALTESYFVIFPNSNIRDLFRGGL